MVAASKADVNTRSESERSYRKVADVPVPESVFTSSLPVTVFLRRREHRYGRQRPWIKETHGGVIV